MVDKIFYITSDKDDIFNVGFRPGLIALADEVGIKVHATNLHKEKKIRVVASGSQDSIKIYHSLIKEKSVPIIFEKNMLGYSPSKMVEYNGPDIDWYGYNIQFMSAQLSKTMYHSNKVFKDINDKLNSIDKKLTTNKNKKIKNTRKR